MKTPPFRWLVKKKEIKERNEVPQRPRRCIMLPFHRWSRLFFYHHQNILVDFMSTHPVTPTTLRNLGRRNLRDCMWVTSFTGERL